MFPLIPESFPLTPDYGVNKMSENKNYHMTPDEFRRYGREVVDWIADYYERNGQLATEHPGMAGDNATRFGLARLGANVPVSNDTQLRELFTRRDAINASIEDLRLRRDAMTADEYQNELLQSMLELAILEDEIEQREAQLQE